jgi:dTDP-4-amino-4,6-dideoxygalactose transaminase
MSLVVEPPRVVAPLPIALPARRFIPSLPPLDLALAADAFGPRGALAALVRRVLAPRRDGDAPSSRTSARWALDQLARGRAQLSYLARAGVSHAIRHFLGERGGTVLAPAYHHGVEIAAIRAAGARVVFYRVDGDMRIDVDDLARRAAAIGDLGAIYVTHYVGFAQPLDDALALARARGVPLVEDCALALFSAAPDGTPLGARGDAAVYCLYKTLPVPHGGLLVGRDLPPLRPTAAPHLSTLRHLGGSLLQHLERRSPVGARLREAARRAARRTVDAVVENVQTGTQALRPRDLFLGASPLARRILEVVDPADVVARRRRNFRRLAEALDGAVTVVGAPLAEGVCPLFLPILIDEKSRALAALAARGIEAIDFWSVGDPGCPSDDFPEVATLRRRLLELPCHQALDDEDIDFVARSVKDVLPP